MLVLSRKKDEKLVIGKNGEITICIVDIRGDKVRVGISAANDIPVHRQEVFDAIQRQNAKSSSSQPPAAGSAHAD